MDPPRFAAPGSAAQPPPPFRPVPTDHRAYPALPVRPPRFQPAPVPPPRFQPHLPRSQPRLCPYQPQMPRFPPLFPRLLLWRPGELVTRAPLDQPVLQFRRICFRLLPRGLLLDARGFAHVCLMCRCYVLLSQERSVLIMKRER